MPFVVSYNIIITTILNLLIVSLFSATFILTHIFNGFTSITEKFAIFEILALLAYR